MTLDGKDIAFDPFTLLEWELEKYAGEKISAPTPFTGGAIGFLGYELGGWLERLPKPRPDALGLPSMVIGLYDVVMPLSIMLERKAWILSHGWPEMAPYAARCARQTRAEFFAQKIAAAPSVLPALDWQSARRLASGTFTRDEVEQRIARIIEYIKAGDIFQANLTQRFSAARPKGLDDFHALPPLARA